MKNSISKKGNVAKLFYFVNLVKSKTIIKYAIPNNIRDYLVGSSIISGINIFGYDLATNRFSQTVINSDKFDYNFAAAKTYDFITELGYNTEGFLDTNQHITLVNPVIGFLYSKKISFTGVKIIDFNTNLFQQTIV